MAEINARREARRQRILENSESRLRRITGKIGLDEIKDNNPQVEVDNLKAESNFEADNIGNGVCNINSDTTLQDPARFDEEREGFLNDINDKRIHSPEQISKPKFVLHTLLFSRISFVLLAGIVNILLVLKLDNLFGQTIIIPYLLLTIRRLYSCTTLHEAQKSNLLTAALILCNVKPRLIYIFKTSLTLLTTILNDFCLYMFSFVLIRYFIIHYYYHDATVSINA